MGHHMVRLPTKRHWRRNETIMAVSSTYYVTMTDTFMSGWGPAKGRKSKLVIACTTLEQAERIERNAKKREEMRYVGILTKKPSYPRAHISWKTWDDMGEVWKK
jgi:hypothetical protein